VATRAELVATRAELAAARAENLELRARLGQNSSNSSKPPSSDPPSAPTRPKRKRRGKRKRGGQPGHKASFGSAPERVDQVHEHRPEVCEHCGADLADGELTGSCFKHYVYNLPVIQPIVDEHRCLDVACPHCNLVTSATLPAGVPRGEYGPTVQAMTAMLRGELKQSMRQTSAVMSEILHVPMATGTVAKVQGQVSEVLAAPVAEAVTYAQSQDRANADETGWREDKKKAWLWVLVTGLVTVFIIRPSRGARAAKDLLGEAFRGILTSDRWSGYNWVATELRQLCWSHLKRDFKSFLDYGPDAKRLGERLLRETRRMFRLWHRVRDGTLSRAELQLKMKPVRRRIEALLEEGSRLTCAKVPGMCKQILRLRLALFTFVDHEGIEPTNNAAERAVRFAVLWRKGSFGCDSATGSRFVERFLTVRATLRAQHRDVYSYLIEACTAALNGTSPPSLLPVAAHDRAQTLAAA